MAAGWSVTGRRPLLSIAAEHAGRMWRHLRTAGVVTRAALTIALRLLLTVAGLGFLCAAAWMLALPAGLAAIGVSLLVLEWAIKSDRGGGDHR